MPRCSASGGANSPRLIAEETGKPFWEADTEVGSMIGKAAASIAAQAERAGEHHVAAAFGETVLRHTPTRSDGGTGAL